MDVIHKVFVSSTYEDLREERAAVERTLLQLKCFPVGMEIFPASDDTAWDFIKSQIDDADYYVLIIAARYGSVDPTTGKSYTEMEYDYAVEKRVPILAFIHSDPGDIHDDKRDNSSKLKRKLESFRTKARRKLCTHWKTIKELQHELSITLTHAKTRNFREGFVRANLAVDHKKMVEMAEENKRLESELRSLKEPETRSEFASGSDPIVLHYNSELISKPSDWPKFKNILVSASEYGTSFQLNTNWNFILHLVGPKLMSGCTSEEMASNLSEAIEAIVPAELQSTNLFEHEERKIELTKASLQAIEIQFRTLGWVQAQRVTRHHQISGSYIVTELHFTNAGMLAFGRLAAVKSQKAAN